MGEKAARQGIYFDSTKREEKSLTGESTEKRKQAGGREGSP